MKKIVFLTGAGMSVESGFKTFRGSDGLWENFPVEEVATHDGWLKDPAKVNNFYNMLRTKLFDAQPNEGHKLIARLEEDYRVTVVTQNVDNLHERAGSTHVIHLHGELAKTCSANDPYNPAYIEELTPQQPHVAIGSKTADGALRRPFIVFFGESVPMIEPAAREMSQADICVIIGSSLVVYPAAGLVRYLRPGVPVYLIDPESVDTDPGLQVTHIKKGASEGMKELLTLL